MNIKINHVIFKLRYAIKTYDIYIYDRQYTYLSIPHVFTILYIKSGLRIPCYKILMV